MITDTTEEGNVGCEAKQDYITLHWKYLKSYLYVKGREMGKFAYA